MCMGTWSLCIQSHKHYLTCLCPWSEIRLQRSASIETCHLQHAVPRPRLGSSLLTRLSQIAANLFWVYLTFFFSMKSILVQSLEFNPLPFWRHALDIEFDIFHRLPWDRLSMAFQKLLKFDVRWGVPFYTLCNDVLQSKDWSLQPLSLLNCAYSHLSFWSTAESILPSRIPEKTLDGIDSSVIASQLSKFGRLPFLGSLKIRPLPLFPSPRSFWRGLWTPWLLRSAFSISAWIESTPAAFPPFMAW